MEIAERALIAMEQENMNEREMIEKYTDLVYKIAWEYFRNQYDADDVCQEVFLKYWKKRPVFHDSEHEKAWFIRVTINQCNNVWKMPWNRRKVSMEEEIMQGILTEHSGKEFTEGISDNIVLHQALDKLTGKERTLIYLFYYEEYKVGEIAECLSISESAAYVRLNRTRKKLKRLLKGVYADEQF